MHRRLQTGSKFFYENPLHVKDCRQLILKMYLEL